MEGLIRAIRTYAAVAAAAETPQRPVLFMGFAPKWFFQARGHTLGLRVQCFQSAELQGDPICDEFEARGDARTPRRAPHDHSNDSEAPAAALAVTWDTVVL